MTVIWKSIGAIGRLGSVALVGAGLLALGSVHALAQKGKGAQVAWVKLCQTKDVTHIPKDKKKKPTQEKREVCRTRYEQLAPFAAMSVEVQAIKNVPDLGLIISFSLPQQMAIKPGILAAVYNSAQWEKVKKKEKVDPKSLKILRVGYTRCGPGKCSAEVPAPKPLIDDMKKGVVMLVKAFRGDGQIVEVPISLAGFNKVLNGKPTDLKAYSKARNDALKQLAARRNQIINQERARRAGVSIPEPKKN